MFNPAVIKAELLAKLAELRSRVSHIEDRLAAPGDPDWQEKAVQKEDEEVLSQIESHAAAEIAEIEEALQRLESRQYGKCASCGHAISTERLAALPYATRCVNCS